MPQMSPTRNDFASSMARAYQLGVEHAASGVQSDSSARVPMTDSDHEHAYQLAHFAESNLTKDSKKDELAQEAQRALENGIRDGQNEKAKSYEPLVHWWVGYDQDLRRLYEAGYQNGKTHARSGAVGFGGDTNPSGEPDYSPAPPAQGIIVGDYASPGRNVSLQSSTSGAGTSALWYALAAVAGVGAAYGINAAYKRRKKTARKNPHCEECDE